jgi:hypothetical protein
MVVQHKTNVHTLTYTYTHTQNSLEAVGDIENHPDQEVAQQLILEISTLKGEGIP